MAARSPGPASSAPGSGAAGIGGLIGQQVGGSITQSYVTGSVSGAGNLGGLVGAQFSGSVDSSYWDTQATGQSNGRTVGGFGAGTGTFSATGLTTAQMQDLSNFATTYADWDFATVWSPPNQAGQNGGSATAYYPELYALSHVVAVAPNTSAPYGTIPIAQYYGLRTDDFITAPATIAGASAASDAGSYALTASGARASDPAYRFVYLPANLTVTPAPLTITANDLSRVYDGTAFTGNGVSYSGFVNGQNEAVLNGSLTYDGSAAGAVNAGAYTIAVSGLSSNNYTITPPALTVTADALSRLYGDANPALTYSVGGLGLVNGDTLDGALATDATAASDVGAYAITSHLSSRNYDISYTGADLSVTPAELTVTYGATQVSSVYGDTPLLTGAVGAEGLKNGDALTAVIGGAAAWSSAGNATSDVGSYAVTGSGLAGDSGNYRFRFVQDAANATALTITPRALTVTADALSRLYGDANPALTYTIGGLGLANGGALATDAARSSIPGDYAVTRGTLAASANYSLRFAPGVLTVLEVAPAQSQSIASTLARDAFAAIVNPLASSDDMTPIAGLFAPPGNRIDGSTGMSAAQMTVPRAIDCVRKRPCPVPGGAPQ